MELLSIILLVTGFFFVCKMDIALPMFKSITYLLKV